MKTISKVLSMFLVVVMCFGLFTMSAFATNFDFGQDASNVASAAAASGSNGFDFGGNAGAVSNYAAPESDTFTPNLNVVEEPVNQDPVVAAEKAETVTEVADNKEVVAGAESGKFEFSDSATFDKAYEDMTSKEKKNITNEGVYEPGNITNKDGSIVMKGVQFDTFKSFKVAYGVNFEDAVTVPNEYVERKDKSVTIKDTWVRMQTPGYYTIWGIKISDGTPVKIGTFQINEGTYDAKMTSSVYTKAVVYSSEGKGGVSAIGTDIGTGDYKLSRFGVASTSGSYTHILSYSEYSLTEGRVSLTRSYLQNLNNGEYYLIGFPSDTSTDNQFRIGKFVIQSGEASGIYTLTPSGQVWYGGTDPLTFYSEIHDLAGKGWNYKPYDIENWVPDVIYSTRSDMSGATSVRVDQYWDLDYGYIMLGTNFLSSLNPENTYYLQVIDAREPELRSNVVTFRVGPTLRALDTDKHVINSTRSLRFRSSSPVARVYVGNIELTDPADFGVSWDGQTVTLSYEFLNKRSGGNTYTIKVLTTSGDYASTTFQVLTVAQGSASPRTGDESNLGLWAAFLLLSGTAIVVMLPKLKKQNF